MGELVAFKVPKGARSGRPPMARGRGEIIFFTGIRREAICEAALLCAPHEDNAKSSGKGQGKDSR
ncbi:conserved protein of unknown function [Methylocella tundrae]|jgi:hypothetical protein|uniref:Uncharacterized protein n=1 Tax=Methylocella tundrae TaxID=227605 RepID=A0A4U8Z4D3_METTU|nr:conserved protein of unknown function [Methylocella tundrae]